MTQKPKTHEQWEAEMDAWRKSEAAADIELAELEKEIRAKYSQWFADEREPS